MATSGLREGDSVELGDGRVVQFTAEAAYRLSAFNINLSMMSTPVVRSEGFSLRCALDIGVPQ